MSDYTPGPWVVCNGTDVFTQLGAANAGGVTAACNDGWLVASPGGTRAATTEDGYEVELSYREELANAKLIAAAPELLEALDELREWVDRHVLALDVDELLSKADRAIKKAKS